MIPGSHLRRLEIELEEDRVARMMRRFLGPWCDHGFYEACTPSLPSQARKYRAALRELQKLCQKRAKKLPLAFIIRVLDPKASQSRKGVEVWHVSPFILALVPHVKTLRVFLDACPTFEANHGARKPKWQFHNHRPLQTNALAVQLTLHREPRASPGVSAWLEQHSEMYWAKEEEWKAKHAEYEKKRKVEEEEQKAKLAEFVEKRRAEEKRKN
ncbi:hypothetical protein K469DRAFT_681715 [Zopfia rhizophila CBS 207.26]|uniref:Uncharacterized protein n=1 Tax=Zopfia rhizophila CBS 207.26 TaxID=1314779 RepID=A0A6A6ETB8_9PEZI|nr:hypothetical protein K469DRAFT_681715 [Zopfia rhizophila CBS 207.26]